MSTTVGIALLYPELLGTYGDGGNATILRQRLAWRGIEADVTEVGAGEAVPESCDLYLMGGGEDGPESLAADELGESRALHRAVDRGAVVFAVCAGFQVLGRQFLGPDGLHEGLGLIDAETTSRAGRRRVGEILVDPDPALGLPPLTGFENHQAVTTLGPGAKPLGRVVAGRGNDSGDNSEGAIAGRVVGTYLHGPVLARNPALADMLLSWVVGSELAPLDDHEVDRLRAERLASVRRRGFGSWFRR